MQFFKVRHDATTTARMEASRRSRFTCAVIVIICIYSNYRYSDACIRFRLFRQVFTCIIRFDNIVSNLKKTYGAAYETSFNELEIVVRFLNSLHDKNAYQHYSNAANL